jgi:methylmalonyl-CoA epimerase
MAQEKTYRILGINHLGLAPKDAAKARTFFTGVLGLGFLGEELVSSQMTNTVMVDSAHGESTTSKSPPPDTSIPTGRPMLEILENQPGQPGPIAAFLQKKGAGIHHVALQVDDVEAAIAEISATKLPDGSTMRMIDSVPRPGSHNTKIAFIHPESTGGILVELVEQL